MIGARRRQRLDARQRAEDGAARAVSAKAALDARLVVGAAGARVGAHPREAILAGDD